MIVHHDLVGLENEPASGSHGYDVSRWSDPDDIHRRALERLAGVIGGHRFLFIRKFWDGCYM